MNRTTDRGVYVISVAAELAGMHPQTLRIYERKGLLDPARTRGGNRRYSDIDIERLRRIAALTAGGLNLAGVKMVLALEDEIRRAHAELEAMRREARLQLADVERRHRRDLVPLSQAVVRFGQRAPFLHD